jgi:hypothetical protein
MGQARLAWPNSPYLHIQASFRKEDFIVNLGTKSERVISGPEMLVYILSSLPNFLETVRPIQLYWDTDYGFGLRQLRPCRNLKLCLGAQCEYLDLSLFHGSIYEHRGEDATFRKSDEYVG